MPQTAGTEIAAWPQRALAPPSDQDAAPAGWLLRSQPGGAAAAGLHSPGGHCWAAGPAGCLQQHAQGVRAPGRIHCLGQVCLQAEAAPAGHAQQCHAQGGAGRGTKRQAEDLIAYQCSHSLCTDKVAISSMTSCGQPGPAGLPDLWTWVCAAPAGASPSGGAAPRPAPPGRQPPGTPPLRRRTLLHHAVAAGPVPAKSGQVRGRSTLRAHHSRHHRQAELQLVKPEASLPAQQPAQSTQKLVALPQGGPTCSPRRLPCCLQ